MSVARTESGRSATQGNSTKSSSPLSDDLVLRPFDLPAARAAGLTKHGVQGPLWQRTARGVYAWSALDPEDTMIRIQTAAELMPVGAAIGGWASLFLQNTLDLDGGPDMRIQRTARIRPTRARAGRRQSTATTGLAPVAICIGPGAKIRPRPEIDVSRRLLCPDDIVWVGGIPCLTATRSLVDLVGRQPSEDGLVSIDAALRSQVTQPDEIAAYLREHPRVLDARRIGRLLGMADGASRSCPETRLRWIWIVEAGLPRPLANPEVEDQHGQLLGLPDLFDPDSALVGESDGSQHRELHAHTSDNAREEGFERHNLFVVRATIVDLFGRRRQLVQRLTAAYRDGCARDRSRDRWVLRRT
jgi:hypothetical protein